MILSTVKLEDFDRSCPIPRSRRSSRRLGSQAGPRRPSSPASTTP